MIVPVILANGMGTRLSPLSREDYPKQLMTVMGGFTVVADALPPGGTLCCSEGNRANHPGEKVFLLTEDQSTYIPWGTEHRLENPGKIPLELIEIQTGSYLGEDDIKRLEDHYGRF
jgi:hypothetical protein